MACDYGSLLMILYLSKSMEYDDTSSTPTPRAQKSPGKPLNTGEGAGWSVALTLTPTPNLTLHPTPNLKDIREDQI